MATVIPALTDYTGTLPNKEFQTQPIFDGAADTWVEWQYGSFTIEFNAMVPLFNAAINEVEIGKAAALTYANLSNSYATNSQAYSISAANSAFSASETQAAVNGLFGLNLGTATVVDGDLHLSYDDGQLESSPYFQNGDLIIEVNV